MLTAEHKKIIAIICVIILGGIIISVYQVYFQPINSKELIQKSDSFSDTIVTQNGQFEKSSPPKILVHIAGGIHYPGVYEVSPNSRVMDAITLAGGILDGVNLDAINLVKHLKDGEKILIPFPKRLIYSAVNAKKNDHNQSAKITKTEDFPLDLNSATQQDLDRVPGIGQKLAKRIVQYRVQHGDFQSVDELRKVKGFTPKKVDSIKEYLK